MNYREQNKKDILHNKMWKEINKFIGSTNRQVTLINKSKIFAGLVVVTLNIASRFVNMKLSKSLENYLKYAFSRDILIFCIVWMGSRDIYVSILITALFVLVADTLFNEDSAFCIFPEHFTQPDPPTDKEIEQAQEVLNRAKLNPKSDNNYLETLPLHLSDKM